MSFVFKESSVARNGFEGPDIVLKSEDRTWKGWLISWMPDMFKEMFGIKPTNVYLPGEIVCLDNLITLVAAGHYHFNEEDIQNILHATSKINGIDKVFPALQGQSARIHQTALDCLQLTRHVIISNTEGVSCEISESEIANCLQALLDAPCDLGTAIQLLEKKKPLTKQQGQVLMDFGRKQKEAVLSKLPSCVLITEIEQEFGFLENGVVFFDRDAAAISCNTFNSKQFIEKYKKQLGLYDYILKGCYLCEHLTATDLESAPDTPTGWRSFCRASSDVIECREFASHLLDESATKEELKGLVTNLLGWTRDDKQIKPYSALGTQALASAREKLTNDSDAAIETLPWVVAKQRQPINPEINRLAVLRQSIGQQLKAPPNNQTPTEREELCNTYMQVGFAVSCLALDDLKPFTENLAQRWGGEDKTFVDTLTGQGSYHYRTFFCCPNTYVFIRSAFSAELFYQEGALQNSWKALYNEYCDRVRLYVDANELLLEDRRFIYWTQKDVQVEKFSSGGTQPT